MSSDLWYGALLSIPIGIGTSLATPWFQRRLDASSEKRAITRTKQNETDLRRVEDFKNNPERFTQYLVYVGLRVTVVGAAMAIGSDIAFSFGNIMRFIPAFGLASGVFYDVGNLAGQAISLIGSLLIINLCRPAIATWTRLRNFDEYRASVESYRVTVGSGVGRKLVLEQSSTEAPSPPP